MRLQAKIAANTPISTKVKHSENKISDKRSWKTKTLTVYTQKIYTNVTAVAHQSHLRPKDLNNDAHEKMRHPPKVT
jgi:hypothetical protein